MVQVILRGGSPRCLVHLIFMGKQAERDARREGVFALVRNALAQIALAHWYI